MTVATLEIPTKILDLPARCSFSRMELRFLMLLLGLMLLRVFIARVLVLLKTFGFGMFVKVCLLLT